jgi:hypothetical protein
MQCIQIFALTPVNTNTQNFVSNDPADCCCSTPLLDATSFKNGYPTTEELVQLVKKESTTAVQCAFCTQFQIENPAEYPFTPHTISSSRKGAFAKTRVLVSPLRVIQLRTMFRLPMQLTKYISSLCEVCTKL